MDISRRALPTYNDAPNEEGANCKFPLFYHFVDGIAECGAYKTTTEITQAFGNCLFCSLQALIFTLPALFESVFAFEIGAGQIVSARKGKVSNNNNNNKRIHFYRRLHKTRISMFLCPIERSYHTGIVRLLGSFFGKYCIIIID